MNMKLTTLHTRETPNRGNSNIYFIIQGFKGVSGEGGKESDVKLWINSGGSSASWVLNWVCGCRGWGGRCCGKYVPDRTQRQRVKHQEFQITWKEHILQELCASNNKHISLGSPLPLFSPLANQPIHSHNSAPNRCRREHENWAERRSPRLLRRNPRNYVRMAPECVICSVPSCSDTNDNNVNILLLLLRQGLGYKLSHPEKNRFQKQFNFSNNEFHGLYTRHRHPTPSNTTAKETKLPSPSSRARPYEEPKTERRIRKLSRVSLTEFVL